MQDLQKLYHKLTIERCKMYLAQLTAATHLSDTLAEQDGESETLMALIGHLGRDLGVLDALASTEEEAA